MQSQSRPRLALAAVAALVLLAGTTPVATGVWTGTTVDPEWFLSRPSLRVDGADHTGVAYQRFGEDPGILFATDATGSWVTTRVTSGPDYAPDLVFDAQNHGHIVFERWTGTVGLYATTDATGSWAAPTLVAADLDPSPPSIAIDLAGNLHVAYTSNYSFAPGLYHVTNATGIWVRTRIAAATYDAEPSLALDGEGHVHIAFTRYAPEAPGIYYATNATGSWVTTRLTTTYDSSPALAFDGAGKSHIAFTRFASGADGLYHATNAAGAWIVEQLPYGIPSSFGMPVLGFDADATLHVFAATYPDDAVYLNYQGLFHWAFVSGSWVGADAPFDGTIRSDDFPSLDFLADGTIQLSFRRRFPTAGIRFYDAGTGSSLIDGSQMTEGSAIDLGPAGERHVAYERRSADQHVAVHATSTGGAWTLDTAGNLDSPFFADVAADSSDKVRIVHGATYYSNETGSWTSDTTLPFGSESHVEVDADGHAHIVYASDGRPYWMVGYRTNATGSWVEDSPQPASSFEWNPAPALALDSAGKPHVALSYEGAIYYYHRKTGTWSSPVAVTTGGGSWPSIAIDGVGKVHIAYIQSGSAPGIYYATNRTGSWVRKRLTRSGADGAPSLALDGASHVYVATSRDNWAANPGIYLVTNATGSWVAARLVARFDTGDVTFAVTGDGHGRLVFGDDRGVMEYESDSPLAASGILTSATLGKILRVQLTAARYSEAQPTAGGVPAWPEAPDAGSGDLTGTGSGPAPRGAPNR